jgi:drug/metabolite transporter (DMT)-like permease
VRANQRLLGGIQVIAAGICFGFLGIFGKILYATGLNVGEVLTLRFSAAALILILTTLVTRPRLLRIDREQTIVCAGLGIFGYAVFATFYFKAFEGLSASLAALLLYTFPSMVTVGAWLWLGEKINLKQKFAVAIAAFGCAALVWGEITVRSWLAFAFGLGSALTYSIYILVSRRWQKNIHPVTSGIYVIIFAAFGLMIFHQPHLKVLDVKQIEYVLGLAIICTILPMILFLSGLQKLSGAEASVLSTIEPIAATVYSYIIFGDQLGLGAMIGGVCILFSVLLTVAGRTSQTSRIR